MLLSALRTTPFAWFGQCNAIFDRFVNVTPAVSVTIQQISASVCISGIVLLLYDGSLVSSFLKSIECNAQSADE
jgi:hypothetical protein